MRRFRSCAASPYSWDLPPVPCFAYLYDISTAWVLHGGGCQFRTGHLMLAKHVISQNELIPRVWCRPRESNSEHLAPKASASANCARPAINGGVSNRYRSGTLSVTARNAGHYTMDTIEHKLAGEAGIEPALVGIKIRCLTTWRLPLKIWSLVSGSNRRHPDYRSGALPELS